MRHFLLLMALMGTLALALPAAAADETPGAGDGNAAAMDTEHSGGFFVIPGGTAGRAIGISIGVGLIVIGAARGIGRIGGSAVESIARQPEAGGRIFTSMLLAAALIEGFTFFALLIQFTI